MQPARDDPAVGARVVVQGAQRGAEVVHRGRVPHGVVLVADVPAPLRRLLIDPHRGRVLGPLRGLVRPHIAHGRREAPGEEGGDVQAEEEVHGRVVAAADRRVGAQVLDHLLGEEGAPVHVEGDVDRSQVWWEGEVVLDSADLVGIPAEGEHPRALGHLRPGRGIAIDLVEGDRDLGGVDPQLRRNPTGQLRGEPAQLAVLEACPGVAHEVRQGGDRLDVVTDVARGIAWVGLVVTEHTDGDAPLRRRGGDRGAGSDAGRPPLHPLTVVLEPGGSRRRELTAGDLGAARRVEVVCQLRADGAQAEAHRAAGEAEPDAGLDRSGLVEGLMQRLLGELDVVLAGEQDVLARDVLEPHLCRQRGQPLPGEDRQSLPVGDEAGGQGTRLWRRSVVMEPLGDLPGLGDLLMPVGVADESGEGALETLAVGEGPGEERTGVLSLQLALDLPQLLALGCPTRCWTEDLGGAVAERDGPQPAVGVPEAGGPVRSGCALPAFRTQLVLESPNILRECLDVVLEAPDFGAGAVPLLLGGTQRLLRPLVAGAGLLEGRPRPVEVGADLIHPAGAGRDPLGPSLECARDGTGIRTHDSPVVSGC